MTAPKPPPGPSPARALAAARKIEWTTLVLALEKNNFREIRRLVRGPDAMLFSNGEIREDSIGGKAARRLARRYLAECGELGDPDNPIL